MSEFEDFLTDKAVVKKFRAAYRGRHDPLDALWWLSHPTEVGPTGAESPAAGRAELQRAAFSRNGNADAERALAELEAGLEVDRAATVEAMEAARHPTPASGTAESEPTAVRARRRIVPIVAIAAAAIVAALIAVQLIAPRQEAKPPADFSIGFGSPTPPPSAASTPTPSAVIHYSGDATCDNLIDISTLRSYQSRVFAEMGQQFLNDLAAGNSVVATRFVDEGGIVCAWGQYADPPVAAYAYSPLTEPATAIEKRWLTDHGFQAGGVSGHDTYSRRGEEVSFGNGYWVYSANIDGASVLSQVYAHAPEAADQPRTDLQKAVYLTSEGLGDLKIGRKVPSSTELVDWVPQACPDNLPTGAWLARVPFAHDENTVVSAFDMVTADGSKMSPIQAILINTPAIPTKSGIRVGDTIEKLQQAFPKIKTSDKGGTLYLSGVAGLIFFDIESVDPDHLNELVIVRIGIVPAATPLDELDERGACA